MSRLGLAALSHRGDSSVVKPVFPAAAGAMLIAAAVDDGDNPLLDSTCFVFTQG